VWGTGRAIYRVLEKLFCIYVFIFGFRIFFFLCLYIFFFNIVLTWKIVRVSKVSVLYIYIVGPKNLATLAHFVLGPRPMPRRGKCPRMYNESPNGLEMLPRTIPSSAFQNPKGQNGMPSKAASQNAPQRNDEYSRTHTRVWCRSSSRKSCHLHIEFAQLTFWSH